MNTGGDEHALCTQYCECEAPIECQKSFTPVDAAEGVQDPRVRGLPAVLHDEAGLRHLQRVGYQGRGDASDAPRQYGSPLGHVAQLVHVHVNYPGDRRMRISTEQHIKYLKYSQPGSILNPFPAYLACPFKY